jgi:hypothetical protein
MHDLASIKPPVLFHELDMDSGWEPVPGGARGVQQILLSGELDEENHLGVRTRLIRFLPGTIAPMEFVHEYWEEVYLISGELITGCEADGSGGERFDQQSYACRPPGKIHGPFASPLGCIFFEIQYFA